MRCTSALTRILAMAGLLAGGLGVAQASVMALELRQACISSLVLSEPDMARPAAAAAAQAAPFPGDGPCLPVSLPYNWDTLHPGRSGGASFELGFQMAAAPTGPCALHVPRVGNRLEIWLNGALITRLGDITPDGAEDYAKSAVYVQLPAQLLQEHNVLKVRLWADSGRRGGLSEIYLGPEQQVRAHDQSVHRWQVSGAVGMAGFSFVVGVVALLLWMTPGDARRQAWPGRDQTFLWAAVAEICWTLCMMDTVLVHAPMRWSVWGVVQALAQSGWLSASVLFGHHVAGWQGRRCGQCVTWAFGVLAFAAAPAAWLTLNRAAFWALWGWEAVAVAALLVFALSYCTACVRRPQTERIMVGLAGLVCATAGIRDWWLVRIQGQFSEFTLSPYSSLLFALAVLCMVVRRFRAAHVQARDLMENLGVRIQERERALAANYRKIEDQLREQERVAERSRILRDMHDGVGAHISAAIGLIQTGRARPEELLQTLRDSLSQLKLSIDVLQVPAGDVATLLASLRYRMEPRLAAAGLTFDWALHEVPPLAHLDGRAMRHLQLMIFEVLSNVLQHAGASILKVEFASLPDGGWLLRFSDNGRGFGAGRNTPTALRTLHQRAQAIGARLEVHSSPGHTTIEIFMPAPP